MKPAELRKFVNENVVGQQIDGLLFEGKVEKRNSAALIVKVEEGSKNTIDPREIKWVTVANRYC